MNPISTPSIAAFLHFMTERNPAIPSFEKLSPADIQGFIEKFESYRGGRYDERRWRDFMQHPKLCGRTKFASVATTWMSNRLRGDSDPLQRYRSVPNKAIFLYTSQDRILRDYLEGHWNAIHEETGDFLDIYDYTIDCARSNYQSFTRDYVNSLKPIPGVSVQAVSDVGLPCMLIWSSTTSVFLPLADVAQDKNAITRRLRRILSILPRETGLHRVNVGDLQAALEVETVGVNARGANDVSLQVEPEPCDVFLSYRRTDRPLIDQIRLVIEGSGLKTWFDEQIPCGERFHTRIRTQIEAATSTIVCLTKDAITSPWVKTEATLAAQRGTMLPLAFDLHEVQIPSPFAEVNVVHFSADTFKQENLQVKRLLQQMTERKGSG